MRPGLLAGFLSVTLLAVVIVSLGLGEVDIPPRAVAGILGDHLGLGGDGFTTQQDAVLWSIRLPRVLLGVFVGAGLAVAGVGFQGIFRNPLADPQLIGISSGAAFGSVLGILLLEAAIGRAAGPLGAFAGGLAAGAVVYSVARNQGRTEVVTLVLSGIAVAAVAGGGAAFISFISRDQRLGSALFYALGSLTLATWRTVGITAVLVAVGLVFLPLRARALNVVLLGDREAHHLGVDVERLRIEVMAVGTLVVGATVAAAGVIGFVGLLIPHGVRMLVGPDHRAVLPLSAIGGAALVVGVDLLARTVASPIEVPIGVITAVVGGPVFLWLIGRTRREHGGWG
ncbi:iron ABC transporter permease [bacterium]|nr:iron ABC transporter permease [bacterium]